MKRLGVILVALQLSGIGATLAAGLSGASGRAVFLLVSAVGIVLGLVTLMHNRIGNFNVTPDLRPQARLVTTGPYRLIRHPMYLSVILFLLGIALYSGQFTAYLGLMVSSGAMIGKARLEERYLAARFPDYEQYRSRTKMLLPFLS